ncbi:hypothetical protein HGRIS_012291 [Hohenbuehelia grisea]|uniref:Clavaminate synthase-like protein n=1 Tax=Hohenbuehelia grisea TaxID=104357 RepID=A0ABR3IRW7_9AGAR
MMPSKIFPDVPHCQKPPPTREPLEFADLAIIDLAKLTTPEGRASLINEVRDAMATAGFFYAINHGYSQAQVLPFQKRRTSKPNIYPCAKTDRIFDIADVPFSQVPPEEKKEYLGSEKETGTYQGYKRRQHWHIQGGILDQVEHYNINRDVHLYQHPEALRPLLPEIAAFARHNHFNVLFPVLRLLALGLELPEDSFVKMHKFDAASATSVRFMKYYPRTEEEEEKSANVWLKGHTGKLVYPSILYVPQAHHGSYPSSDFGSITILWSQPVSGLQVLGKDDQWRWVKHIDNALVINAGDAMELVSGGYYRATIHRVVQPPADQLNLERHGAFYFSFLDDDAKLAPVLESPVLQRHGVAKNLEQDKAPTMEAWRKARTTSYGVVELVQSASERRVEEEIIEGVLVKHYN